VAAEENSDRPRAVSFDAEELLLEIGGADVSSSFLLSLRIRLLKRTYSSSIGI
jgi:hypothetical protein